MCIVYWYQNLSLTESGTFDSCPKSLSSSSHPLPLPLSLPANNFKLIIAANRDELFDRPSLPLSTINESSRSTESYQEHEEILESKAVENESKPRIFCPIDLEAGGTWIGINELGCFAFLTNVRNFNSENIKIQNQIKTASQTTNKIKNITSLPKSRGFLIKTFLSKDPPVSAKEYSTFLIEECLDELQDMKGFNLVIGDMTGSYYLSNICRRGNNRDVVLDPPSKFNSSAVKSTFPSLNEDAIFWQCERITDKAINVLTNASLNTPWPKANIGANIFKNILDSLFEDEEIQLSMDEERDVGDKEVGGEIILEEKAAAYRLQLLLNLHEKLLLNDNIYENHLQETYTNYSKRIEDYLSSIFVRGLDFEKETFYEENIMKHESNIITACHETVHDLPKDENGNECTTRKPDAYKVDENLFFESSVAIGKGQLKPSSTSLKLNDSKGKLAQRNSKLQPSSRKIFGTVSQTIILVDSSNRVFVYEFLLPRHFPSEGSPSLINNENENPNDIISYNEGIQSFLHFRIHPTKTIK